LGPTRGIARAILRCLQLRPPRDADERAAALFQALAAFGQSSPAQPLISTMGPTTLTFDRRSERLKSISGAHPSAGIRSAGGRAD
jgi:hypothetical protein